MLNRACRLEAGSKYLTNSDDLIEFKTQVFTQDVSIQKHSMNLNHILSKKVEEKG
jgi:hypothetical protein